MYRLVLNDDRGAVTTDWVALSAGIIVLGLVVVHSVMGNSATSLLDGFDRVNSAYQDASGEIAALEKSIEINK